MNSLEASLKELKNPDAQIRIKAIQALGEIGYKLPNFPIESLIQIFREDEDEVVRQTAGSIIIKINEPIVTHLLQNLYYQWDNESYANQTIVDSLEKLGQASIFTLISILNNPQSPLRSEAAHALSLLKDPQGIKAIIKVLEGAESHLCLSALIPLAKFEDVELALETLTTALKSQDWAIRNQAVKILEIIGDKRGFEPLFAAINDESEFVRFSSISALQYIGDERAVEGLIDSLKDEYVRSVAARALGEIGDNRAVVPLIRILLKDINEITRYWAAEALGKIGDLRALAALELAREHDKGQRLSNATIKDAADKAIKIIKEKQK